MIYIGTVESRMDPLKLGRCQVRVVGLHTHDKIQLPTADLPWATPIQPITSAGISGIGVAPVGLVEGSWVIIVFRDIDCQQPLILGSIGGIPQAEGAVDANEPDILYDETTGENRPLPLTAGDGSTVISGSGEPVVTGAVIKSIPGIPPYGSLIPQKSYGGIVAIGAAMDAAGITSSYARASILGIIGGESDWVPRSESFYYSSPTYIKQVFSWLTTAQAESYAKWTGTRGEFFSFIYGPDTPPGRSLGNTTTEEAGMYFGRGYVQLTGKYNYSKFGKITGLDLINNPDLVNDPVTGATVAVAFFTSTVKVSQNDPGYFEAALRAVGANIPSIRAKKQTYYDYFLALDSDAYKSSPSVPTMTAKAGVDSPGVETNSLGIPIDRQHAITMGFRDPNMKYPLRELLNEPDTNRLARGKTSGTLVQRRDAGRITGIERADGTTFDQPAIPYNSQYPYNKIFSSESGHIQEFDDTPENERTSLIHRSGTFTEVDVNGTQVNRIVGDGYQIIDRNGYIYIRGAGSITIEGDTNIYINANANIKVAGDTELQFQGDVNATVAGDYNLAVGGDYKVKASNIYEESTGVINLVGSSAINADAGMIYWNSQKSEGTGLSNTIETGIPKSNNFETLLTPPRNSENEANYETPDEIASTEGIAAVAVKSKNIVGEKSTISNTPEKEAVVPPATTGVTAGSDCSLINAMSDFPMSIRLSTNFTLGELIANPSHVLADQNLKDSRSSAPRLYTKQEIVCNLKGVCENVLEPLINLVDGGKRGFKLTSGYRYAGKTANESVISDHPKGAAVDIMIPGREYDYKAHYDLAVLMASKLPFHQLILEYRDPGRPGNNRNKRSVWIHISHRYTGNAKQAFTMLNDTTYGQGFYLL